jgi:AcrR family transcriptional regulator
MTEKVNPRTHSSPLRRAQAAATRARILDAAAAAFAINGYEHTRIEDVAAEAGVAYPTVYKAIGNKPAVLAASVAHAMSGGDERPVDTTAWFHEQLDAPDAETQLRLIARNARALYERCGSLLDVVRIAAANNEQAAELWNSINAERLKRSRTTAKRLATKAALRAAVPAIARTLWALTLPEIYVLQVHHGDLSADSYERWLADLLVAAIVSADEPG